jgi:NAD(P)-dependent dehydrogenase (short-subunit alcohol dehydrogenase family)
MKTALITGGTRGIGRGIAELLHEKGLSVAITSRNPADETARGRFTCIQADNANARAREIAADAAIEALGSIDLLVNNAGIAPEIRSDLLELSEESMRESIDTNLIGPFFLTQRIAKHMIQRGGGMIIIISSISAHAVSLNRGGYCVSKAGLSMMTRLYAARLAEYGIPVYEIRPGIIRTDMTWGVSAKYDSLIAGGLTPIARWGQPEDVAKAVYMLSQNLIPFSTGDVINVDGGFHLSRL